MSGVVLTDLTEWGTRVVASFEQGLADIGRENEDWSIGEDSDGITVKLVPARDGEVLSFGSDEFRISRLSDKAIAARVREYQDTILDRQD